MGDHGVSKTPKKSDSQGNTRGGTPVPTPSPGKGKRPQLSQGHSSPLKKLKFGGEIKLRVLLPNATTVDVVTNHAEIQSVEELVRLVRGTSSEHSSISTRDVKWNSVWIEDRKGEKLEDESLKILLSSQTKTGKFLLILQDGLPESRHTDKTMWNVTPKPAMLHNLPHGYTLETALADHVDNALQAVWFNPRDCHRLVSVSLSADKITIFDTGQGMDGDEEGPNCIENWGTVGGSTHRDAHQKGVGGQPPFLKPYLGKYGAGGVSAAFHLGGCVTVSSKTRQSRHVVFLVLEHGALLERHKHDPTERVWKTNGGVRPPTKEERGMSPHGSFTRVEISKLKAQYCLLESERQYWKVETVRQLLKDIYFPYIQSEKGSSSMTVYPVTFKVNDVYLTDIEHCETATFNLHTCNAESPFKFDVYLTTAPDEREREGKAAEIIKQGVEEANARVTCHYYPNEKGKEALETVIEQLMELMPGYSKTFETMDRVSIRWLGRLLPEVKLSILPLMEVSSKKETTHGVRSQWAKRVRASIDTDAGFHPNQSKTELERDQPFVVALKRIGSEDFTGTAASGVHMRFTIDGNVVSTKNLTAAYMQWLKDMHERYDEEVIFMSDPLYVFDHQNALKELGVQKKEVIVFHKHVEYAKREWRVDGSVPLHVKLPKGGHGLKSDLYATIEYFFHDGLVDQHGEVKFLCRALEVDEADGCKIERKADSNLHFELKKSRWFPAAVLCHSSTKCLDLVAWKKKVDEVLNKSPSCVEILNEEDSKKLDVFETFPADRSKFEAGFTLPKEFGVVIRPKKGTGPRFKQGMIVPEPMSIIITTTHYSTEGHSEVVFKDSALFTCKNNVKGLYLVKTGSEANRQLLSQGTYKFHIAMESNKYTNVRPAICYIHIVPSKVTAKWTLCNHSEDCMLSDHAQVKPISIRLNERFGGEIFIQKYDQYGNKKLFEKPMELDIEGFSLKGESLEMKTKIQCNIAKSTRGRYRLQVQSMLFTKGSLKCMEKTYLAVLRMQFTESQCAEIGCEVLPGLLATAMVKTSSPLICEGSMCFQEALQPGSIIKQLTIQGLDAYGNKVDVGQKIQVQLDGLEFQDNGGSEREVDELGNLRLGGLLKVACHYNSKGSITIASGSGSNLSTISFKTVRRKLVATGVPTKSCVGRPLSGVCVKIIDELGQVDESVDGYSHSLIVDWQEGVTYPFAKGKCELPSFHLPQGRGPWKGKVCFSANPTLSALLEVELVLATACELRPAKTTTQKIWTAKCGVPFTLQFSACDDQHQPASLTTAMMNTITLKAEAKDIPDDSLLVVRPCEVVCKGITMSDGGSGSEYEALIVLYGPVGSYSITLLDASLALRGKVESTCELQHGKVSKLTTSLLDRADHTFMGSILRPTSIVEVTRGSPLPGLAVTILDAYDNICISSEGANVAVKIEDCPQWRVCVAKVFRGIGQVEKPLVVMPVGKYCVSVELDALPDDFHCLDEKMNPITVQFTLKVKHGNYPSAMRFLDGREITVSLTGEDVQYIPLTTVFVESADNQLLQCRPSVGVKLQGHNSLESDPKEFLGTFVPIRPDFMVMAGEANVDVANLTAVEFSQVCVPSQAGTYVLEFSVLESDVPSILRRLIVRHGPPMRVEIVQRESGKEMGILNVNLLDAHGNECRDISGLHLSLQLDLGRNFNVNTSLLPCTILGATDAVVKAGKGDFGVFKLSKGIPGVYKLKVIPVGEDGGFHLQSVIPGEAEILVIHGNISETIQHMQDLAQANKKKLKAIQKGEGMIQQRRAAINGLKKNIIKQEEELRLQQRHQDRIQALRLRMFDDETLQAEQCQPVRTEQHVTQALRFLGQRGTSALTLLEAQSDGNFLSPHSSNPAAMDVVGLVVMLARVENDALNRVLSEFLGLGTLLVIICKSQCGVHALEEYDQQGNIDESKGLHGFARSHGYKISGRFDVLALKDLRPFSRRSGQAVVMQHPQRILNIDPPILRHGEIPGGFLGYAVNLLHLRPEHLDTRVHTRTGEVGLRESLFFHLLGFLQVFDTRANMVAAKEAMTSFNEGAVSLDGGVIRKNLRQQLGKSSDKIPFCFGTVPFQERMVGSLMPPACDAFQRLKDLNSIKEEIRMRHDGLGAMQERLASAVMDLSHLDQTVGKTKTEQQRLIESSELFQNQIDELLRAQQAIVGMNASVVDHWQGERELPRAFMM